MRTIGVVGMGYVGTTLAAALAQRGSTVHCVDTDVAVLEALRTGRLHVHEPGVAETFEKFIGTSIRLGTELPVEPLDAVLICVSTPVDQATREPDLRNVVAAAKHIARHCEPGTLVAVRSTVPVGTCRNVVLRELRERWDQVRLVMAPERTIQGQALHEIVDLPQVIGGLDEESVVAGVELFRAVTNRQVTVSSLETAEFVKLVNNCHTDLIYSFGNEVAVLAGELGIDPLEAIAAANADYPRPDVAKPGYVGGACLSKDPYLLLASRPTARTKLNLVRSARAVNEALPGYVARRVVELAGGAGSKSTLLMLGWAYKGRPSTDDVRGAPAGDMVPIFAAAGLRVLGHDPLVGEDVIRAQGAEPVDVETGFRLADVVLVVTDHPQYRALDLDSLLSTEIRPSLVYDSWRVLDAKVLWDAGVRYASIGYEPGEPGRAR